MDIDTFLTTLFVRLQRTAQRLAHQPPRARRIRKHQKSNDLAREAVGLHARVGPQRGSFGLWL